MMGHNGGPFIFDTASDLPGNMPKMHYFKLDIAAFRKAIFDKPLDIRGAYISVLLALYEHMEPLPADDAMAMLRCGIKDARIWRRVKGTLIELGLIYQRPNGRLSNPRFEEEIISYVVEFKNRQAAALEREKKAKVVRAQRPTYGVAKPQLGDSYGLATPQLGDSYPLTNAQLNGSDRRKTNEINEHNTTTVPQRTPQADHEARLRARVLELELEREEKKVITGGVEGARFGEDELAPGLYVNCDTVRHRDFTVSITGIAMQLATANLGLSKNDAIPVARESAIGHAMQWAAEISNGKPPSQVVPQHSANFIRGAIIAQRNKSMSQQNAKPSSYRSNYGRPAPPKRPTRSEIADAVRELEERDAGIIDVVFERVEK